MDPMCSKDSQILPISRGCRWWRRRWGDQLPPPRPSSQLRWWGDGWRWRPKISTTWNALFLLGNFTPETSNYCLKNRALGFPGIINYTTWKGSMAQPPCIGLLWSRILIHLLGVETAIYFHYVVSRLLTGWWLERFFMFTPKIGEDSHWIWFFSHG